MIRALLTLVALLATWLPSPAPIIIRPLEGDGLSLVDSDEDGTNANLWGRGDDWIATRFTASKSYTVVQVDALLSKVGAPTGDITAHIYTDASNEPGTEVGSGSDPVAVSGLAGSATWESFPGMSCSVTGSTTYWVVLKKSTSDAGGNYVNWFYDNTFVTNVFQESSDSGTNWSPVQSKTASYRTYE